MSHLSDNYYLRDHCFRRDEVPTISMMTKKMTPPLAAVYFKSMKPRLKEIAGLEPSLQGGGSDWFVPPEELLRGRTVLKPARKEILSKLNYEGIATIGTMLFQKHREAMDTEIEEALTNSDIKWRNYVTNTTSRLWDDLVALATKKNSDHITKDFKHFVYLYRQSLGKIEILFHESAVAEIKNTKDEALHEMQKKYAAALKHQATLIYDQYEKKLKDEIPRLKTDFMQKVADNHTAMADKIHDLNVDKHMAVEKLRQCLQCQNLACGIYVALKEREECLKETNESKHQHRKKVKIMRETIQMKDLEIHLEDEKERKRQEFCKIWKKKVCRVVKTFQKFVSYCLNKLPEHAEFFINVEKLMLLQVSEALEDPAAASIIELEGEQFHTPVPQAKPFYLFCDRGYKPEIHQDLCPKPSGISSASGLPVMIINKRCLYAACDNFDQFTNKVTEYIYGGRGDDADFKDDLVYEHFVPVKYGSTERLLESKFESSLLQILQQEIANISTDEDKVPTNCKGCGLPWCSCLPRPPSVASVQKTKLAPRVSPNKVQSIGRSMELEHEREPKWDSFCKYVEPKKCSCAKTVKKLLVEHLPVYMRHMRYGPPEIPDYEICSVRTLKALVKKARKKSDMPCEFQGKTKDMGTQYFEPEFEILCTCFSSSEETIDPAMLDFTWTDASQSGSASTSYLTKRTSSFATSRAQSLRNLLNELPEVKEIFTKKDCAFE